MERESGRVKWFSDEKGFGFIARGGGARDLFVHYSEIENSVTAEGRRTLLEDQQVTFVEGEGRKGREAKEVRVVENDPNVIE